MKKEIGSQDLLFVALCVCMCVCPRDSQEVSNLADHLPQ